jgi:release factor glutamine methyltransferase
MSAAPVSIGLAWRLVRDRFREAGLASPELDARLLAQHAFGLDAMALVRREREALPEGWGEALEAMALRRLAGEPVSRILGEREFWGLRFALNPATLDPRPETELLVAAAIEHLQALEAPHFLDLGTGSGAIAVAILDGVRRARGTATDIAEAALRAARANAERHGVAGRVAFLQGAWWQAVPHVQQFDLIVSNPPYIASAAVAGLQPEVRLFDPPAALDGGWDGLDAYRAIASQAARRLVPGGALLLEIGATQGAAVAHILERAGFARIEIQKDLAGLDRMVLAHHS